MKFIIFLLFFIALHINCHCTYVPTDWQEITTVGVSRNSPTQQQAIFVNSYTGVGPVAGAWHTVDVSDMVPVGTKCIFVSGLLIITHGTTAETANLTISFRRYGETENYYYIGQTIEVDTQGGQRSTMSCWIPLSEDLKFDFFWTRTNTGQWPTYSAYGINLSLNAWGK